MTNGYTWKNTSQTLTATPVSYQQASNKADLIAIVEAAVGKGQKIRVTGGRHSWYPLVLTDQAIDGTPIDEGNVCLIDVSAMNAVTTEKTPDGRYLVHAEPGATMGDLETAMMGNWPDKPAPDLLVALPTLGVIPTEIQLGGFIAAGCHGTGWEQPTVPDIVRSIEMILVDEQKNVSVRTFSADNPDDPMDVIRVNLGTIGIATMITFDAEPLFSVHGVDTVDDLMTDVINRSPDQADHPLKTLVEGTDYLELFWFPFNATTTDLSLRLLIDLPNTKVWKKMGTRLPNQNGVPPPDRDVPSQVWDELEAKFGAVTYATIAEWSSGNIIQTAAVEGMLAAMSSLAYLRASDDYVAPVTRFCLYQRAAFPVLDFSFAIPMDPDKDPYYQTVSDAWYAVVDAVADWAQNKPEFYQRYPVNLALHARFIKNSQALLSPAYQPAGSGTHTCWIEILSGAATPDAPGATWYENYNTTWAEFCQLIGQQWLALGGRPHWAKQWQLLDDPTSNIYSKLPAMYGGNLTTFKQVRDELDPTETFLYPWTAKIFG